MPRVHQVKAARKDYPEIGVKKGESYYWWKIKLQRGGLLKKSKTPPKRSQLTMSEFYGTLYDIQDETHFEAAGDFADLTSMRDDIVSQLEELRDAQQEKLDNMPEGLQQGSTGEMLQERYDALDSAIDELNGVDIPDDEDWADLDDGEGGEGDEEDKAEREDKDAKLKEVAQELDDALQGISV